MSDLCQILCQYLTKEWLSHVKNNDKQQLWTYLSILKYTHESIHDMCQTMLTSAVYWLMCFMLIIV